jgi:chemotaxis protein CheD
MSTRHQSALSLSHPAEMGTAERSDRARGPASDAQTVYLHPGQLFASAVPCAITTVLGSCVSVCLYDVGRGIGGANHFLLPHAGTRSNEPLRCGASAIEALLRRLLDLGARRHKLAAKVFGGAHVLQAIQSDRYHLGTANVDVARSVLSAERIPVLAEDVGGTRGRKLRFVTGDGSAWVQEI